MKKILMLLKRNRKLTRIDINHFLRQLATLMMAGVPILKSCDLLEKSQHKIAARSLIQTIKRELLSGKTLYESLPHQTFDALASQLIRIGEHTGKLDELLMTLADYQERQWAFRRKINQILFYPCIILIFSFVVTFSMLIFIIPRFADLFQHTKAKLPLITKMIFACSTLLNQHLTIISLSALIIIVFLCSSLGARLRKKSMLMIMQLPFIRPYLKKIILARFARNLSITFSAGLALNEALKLSAHAPYQAEFTHNIAKLHNKISAGISLHHAMASLPYFPILMIQMIKIGEESGMLESMLDKIADFIEAEIDQLLHRFSQLLEPLIMLILGALIGGLVIGLYLPLFKLGSAF